MIILNKNTELLTETVTQTDFPLFKNEQAASVYISDNEYPGVKTVLGNFINDIENVSGISTENCRSLNECSSPVVIVGTLGHSEVIDELAESKKIDVSSLQGAWDSFIIQTIPHPDAGKALVIVGSNKRGTIYGMYEISRRMGVSPWHWFADVPVKQKTAIGVKPGLFFSGEPSVKYRGFFINDEYPCLAPFAHEKFGGLNHKFYVHVFDLLLRMKGNYFWPAMWNECFHDDDPENTCLADELGVIIGTSHHEPLMRAWKEWQRYGKGDWNLETNRDFIVDFWKQSVKRQGDRECIFTVGMRGDGDEALTEDARDEVLDDILTTQRNILSEVLGKAPEDIPQMWAVYKEVQEYYEKGAKIPDDILVMLCDDNWGNIRKLPRPDDTDRKGGFGLYYHFDYVGGPRNYKWVNTSPLPRVREQLHLAYKGGIDKLWIVNVGDIKPLEFPLSFFLDYAWNLEEWGSDDLDEYTRLWANEQFGGDLGGEIAECITAYARINGRRKPELLDADSYSNVYFGEAEQVLAEYTAIADKVLNIKKRIPAEYSDSFYELVEFPVCASANLYKLRILTGLNRLYAKQGRISANMLADEVRKAFEKDREMCAYYNNELAGGKWVHMMDQTHISYTIWQQPDEDVLPELEKVTSKSAPSMGVAVEGSPESWPGSSLKAVLPELVSQDKRKRYLDIFNRGSAPFTFEIETLDDFLITDVSSGTVDTEQRVNVSIDWSKVPDDLNGKKGTIIVKSSDGAEVSVSVPASKFFVETDNVSPVFIESDGYISIEAEHYSGKTDAVGVTWQTQPGLGKTLSGVTTMPIDASVERPTEDTPCLEYCMFTRSTGSVQLSVHLSPTNDFLFNGGLKYAVSIDKEAPRIVNIHNPEKSDGGTKGIEADTDWDRAVGNQVRRVTTSHTLNEPGMHTVRYWLVDPGVVLEKLVLWTGKQKPSYLGPPESPQA